MKASTHIRRTTPTRIEPLETRIAPAFAAVIDLGSLDGVNGFKLSGAADSDKAGRSVSGAGDVDGDGFDDLIIGAYSADEGGANRGAAYVVFGIPGGFSASVPLSGLSGANGFKLSGVSNGDYTGNWVSGAGDVNGDGFDDVIIGAYLADEGTFNANRGASYVVFGKAKVGGVFANVALSDLNGTDGFKLSGVANGDQAGYSVSAAGDVNGDTFDDLIIGAPFADESGNNRGASYLVFGKANGFSASMALSGLDGTNGFKLSGGTDSDIAGVLVSAAGDVNGDGFADLLIGATGADEAGTDRGAAYVVFGKAGGFGASVALSGLDGTNGFKLSGVADSDFAGGSVSAAGDVNGDGFADLLIGASGADEGALNANRGAAYVVFGKGGGFGSSVALSGLDGTNGFKLSGVADNDLAGFSISTAGDVNGDGFADLLIGAKGADEGELNANRGAAYVVFGKVGGFGASVALSGLDGTNGFKLSGVADDDSAGFSVSAAGDVNGDGFADLLIGAYGANEGGTDRGATYVLFGQPDMTVDLFSGTLTLFENGAPSDADLTLSLNGSNIRITDPTHTFAITGDVGLVLIDPHTVEVPLSSVTSGFNIAPGGGNDSLIVDFSNGNPLPSVFSFSGGPDTDTLTVSGGTAANVNHVVNANGGAAVVDTTAILYDGIEGVTDTISAANRFLGFDSDNDIITLTTDEGLLTTLTSSIAAPIRFASPTSFLFLDSGGGADSITVTSLNPSFSSSLFIFGDFGDDTITLAATSPGFTGFVNIAGEGDTDTLNIGSAFTAGGITASMDITNPLPRFNVGPDHADFITDRIAFQPGGDLSFKINGPSNAPIFGQLRVNGTLDLIGADIFLTSTLTTLPTAPLTIIDLAGSSPVIGTFNGLAEGASLTLNGATFRITYTGDTGNDVQLIPLVPIQPGVVKLGELDGTNGFIVNGQSNGDYTGGSVSSAGDFNGDGFADFIIGAEAADAGFGAAYVVFGKTTGFPNPLSLSGLSGTDGFKMQVGDSNTHLGLRVNKAGDVNGDGMDDIVVSAGLESDGSTYVIFGDTSPFPSVLSLSNLDGTNGFKLQGTASFDRGPHASVSAGDLNGDGISDIIIGIPYAEAAYVVFGRNPSAPFPSLVNISALTGADGFRIHGDSARDYFGTSVSAGDVNGDGFDDLLIGAPKNSPAVNPLGLTGAAYVLFGKSTAFPPSLNTSAFNGTTGFKIFGGNEAGYLGYSVSAGDINGDGISDIIIGAPEGNGDVGGSGTAYVVFGKRSGHTANYDLAKLNGANGFALAGEANGNLTGGSVNSAGDFNGDGFDDILIGAIRSNTNGYASGSSYLVFGRPSGFPTTLPLSSLNGTTGFKFLGNPGDNSGSSVNAAGDVNDDGLQDIIIGAPRASVSEGGTEGRAYVVFGSEASHAIPVTKDAGKTLTYTDTDGDVVNITVSKGKITADMLTFGPDGGLFMVDLTAGGTFKDGANLNFTIKKAVADGIINVGAINAAGIRLGAVKITGDLGQIDIGGDPLKAALKSLTVGSLGVMGAAMQLPGTINPLTSDITGNLPKFTVKGNVNLATINVSGKLGNLTVKGEFKGLGALTATQLQGLSALGHDIIANVDGGTTLATSGLTAGSIGSLNVTGTITDTAITSSGTIGSVTAGDVNNGAIVAAGALRVVKVFGSITSDDANLPSVIAALARIPGKPPIAIAINTFLVRGDVKNAEILIGYNSDFLAMNSDASVGAFTVKGVWTASSLTVGVADVTADGFGRNDFPIFAGVDGTGLDLTPKIIARIARITIGSLLTALTAPADGTATDGDFFGITAERIVKAKINGVKIPLLKPTKDLLNKDTFPLGTFNDFFLIEV